MLSLSNRSGLACLAGVLLTVGAVKATEIQLKPSVHSPGSLVLFGDVAEIRQASPDRVIALQRIELFPAPPAGRSRTLRKREVRELLALHGVAPGTYRLVGPEATRILAPPPASPLLGKAKQPSPARQEPVKQPATPRLVVAARRDLNRGEVLRAADLQLVQLTGGSRRQDKSLVYQIAEAVGMEIVRPVAADRPLDLDALRRPVLVHRGKLVTVTARAAGVAVRTSARSLDDGAQGELVALESLGTRQRMTARVTGPQQVEVYASGVAVSVPTSTAGNNR